MQASLDLNMAIVTLLEEGQLQLKKHHIKAYSHIYP